MTPVEIYLSLPHSAQAACGKVASALFSKAVGSVAGKIAGKDAIAAIYRKWQGSFQSPEGNEQELNTAFEEFFSRKRVIDELAKLGRDQYAEVNFDVLVDELRESLEFARCPLPDTDLHKEIDGWVRDLRAMLRDSGVGAARPDPRPLEAPIENDTLARKKYLEWVVRQHRYIQFSGMAVVDERAEVEISRVFVMPRLTAQQGSAESKPEKPAEAPAHKLLTAKKAPRRLVILGGPGSGKTTLLEALALAFVQPERFAWARTFPQLLPVFYRIRDLDKDLEAHGTIWDCIQHQCSRQMGEALPLGFFPRQMQASGVALLFDGLDEAGSLARRNEIVGLIGALAEQLPPSSRLIVTSRPMIIVTVSKALPGRILNWRNLTMMRFRPLSRAGRRFTNRTAPPLARKGRTFGKRLNPGKTFCRWRAMRCC